MKRGKDDEKIMVPMFPRLHVNDTGKGGPRAPPRNKMALYEQLSVPSQRFNHQSMRPLNQGNTRSLVPPGSDQSYGMEKSLHLQLRVPPMSVQLTKKSNDQQLLAENARAPLPANDRKNQAGVDDDSMVPVFENLGADPSQSGNYNGCDKEKVKPVKPDSSYSLVKVREVSHKDSKQNCSLPPYSRQEVKEWDENQKASPLIIDQSIDFSAGEGIEGDKPASKCEKLDVPDVFFRQGSRNGYDEGNNETGEGLDSSRGTDNRAEAQMRNEYNAREDPGDRDEVVNYPEFCRTEACISLHQRNDDATDGVSETSMVDSGSSTEIGPDGIVEILGQKRFWKARTAIANQQRVFAVQVFELHRLIKVQKLIAGLPHILLETSAYLGKSPSKPSPKRKLRPPEYIVKTSRIRKHKHDSERTIRHGLEFSAENTVEGTPVLPGNDNNQQSVSHMPFIGNSFPASATLDTQMGGDNGGGGGGGDGSWSFPPQPTPGTHQWLIPVMSPSEGLIYKPCPAPPGFAGHNSGGYHSHFTPGPVTGNLMGTAYGVPVPVPVPPYHQGISASTGSHGYYFPPYGTLPMTPSFPRHYMGQTTPQRGHPCNNVSDSVKTQQQGSCNFPNLKNEAVNVTEETIKDHPGNQVIRVVPHKPTLATESAARIFRSIQAERKLNDSI